jgi:hypothetical protein
MQLHKRVKATVMASLRPMRLEPAIQHGATQTERATAALEIVKPCANDLHFSYH